MNKTMKNIATAFTAVLILVLGSFVAVESTVAESDKALAEFDQSRANPVQPNQSDAPKVPKLANNN